ncbi:MAG: NTP transferase domain-containing protein [Propionibacteriales bacterium]|nr:NTP transferase domain-containing protein [Propionibacteriales bacterium]
MTVAGLVLAAGAGRRMGGPKALVRDGDGTPWVVRAVRTLADAGCSPVLVVVGADATEVGRQLAGEPVTVVEAADWADGMGASLRAGLAALSPIDGAVDGPVAVAVTVVDQPGLDGAVVRRVAAGAGVETLARATYSGRPGHPVVLGRVHWDGARSAAVGDLGARDYLTAHGAVDVECGDLSAGVDVDLPADLPAGHRLPD